MLRFPDEAARKDALALYAEKTSPLHTFVPEARWDTVAGAFKRGFATALGVEFEYGALSHSEWELAKQLVEDKYSKLEWRKARISFV
jgi:lipoate-protein ligase A